MSKKALTILGIAAGIVVILVVGYLVYMYGLMPASQM
jgi:cytochrome bd-type quinol oxidase subunit 2